MRILLAPLAVAAALAVAPAPLGAHFKLVEPASWIVENERGDPQKSTPCGVTADAKMSGAVSKVTGGSSAPQSSRDHLPPGALPRGAGRELARGAAARPDDL